MDIKVSGHDFLYDITSMSMLFFPGEKTNFVKKSSAPFHMSSTLLSRDDCVVSTTGVYCKGKWHYTRKKASKDCDMKNLVKQTFYTACSKACAITSPWGILTGIRPVSVYERHRIAGDDARSVMKNEYYLSDSKIQLLEKISKLQRPLLGKSSNDVSVYISIPFCPGRCSYCSFISVNAVNASRLLDEYLEKLFIEIRDKGRLIRENSLCLKSVYVGGGTPGILSEHQLLSLLKVMRESFDLESAQETCFELGRPETVSPGKLKILKDYNINRICINTQSTNDEVLKTANRNHTAKDYFDAIKLASGFGFDSINTDLIAGLPGESTQSFCNSLDEVIATGVDNITVHTLAIKRAARLSDAPQNFNPNDGGVIKMLEYAYTKLERNEYLPYYIYRQKNCVSNGENVGFCKRGTLCRYNIYMMEDVHSVIACGAGGSSKIVTGRQVTRFINVKYPMEYVKEFDKVQSNTTLINNKIRADLSYD